MDKPYLTISEFYKKVTKTKTKYSQLKDFIEKLEEKYNIISLDDEEERETECPPKYPESYIVNQSSKRFKNEIKDSHFLAHWKDLCIYPEIANTLRFVYNIINLKKDELINLLDSLILEAKTSTNGIILEDSNKYNLEYKQLSDFLGLSNISRIKIDNQTKSEKIMINFSLIINLEKEYPRNLLSCPSDKIILGERHKNIKKKTLNFVCHKHNILERLKTNKLCLSIWLMKNKKGNVKLKMGSSYLSDSFPAEFGTINNFISDITKLGFTKEAALYIEKIKEYMKKSQFYAVETHDPRVKLLKTKKLTKKLTKK